MNILRLFLSSDLSRLSEEVADLTRRVDRIVKTEELRRESRRKAQLERFIEKYPPPAPVDQGSWFPCLYRSKPRPDGLKCVQYVESFFDSADAAKEAAALVWPDPFEDCTYGAVKVADVR